MAKATTRIQEGTGKLFSPLPFTDAEYQRRLDGVRRQMEEKGLDAFISFTPESIYYLSGHDTPGYYFYQACVVTREHGPINVLRGIEATNTWGRGWKRLAVPYQDREDPIVATLDLLKELGVAGKTVGAEEEAWFVSPKRYAQLGKGIADAGGKLVDASGLVEYMRATKSAEELVYVRQGARACEAGVTAGIEATREWTNENEVAAAISAALIRHGGEYAGLPPFITSGPRTNLVHSTWAGRVLEKGDMIHFELPGVIKRYCAALFRPGTIGEPSDEIRRRSETLYETLDSVIAAMKPGATPHEVHAVRKAVFAKHGYGDRLAARTGYSLGINYPPDWGEGYIVSIWDNDHQPLRPGMVFHLTPSMVPMAEGQGQHITISETVLVTDTGCEIITNYPRGPFVV